MSKISQTLMNDVEECLRHVIFASAADISQMLESRDKKFKPSCDEVRCALDELIACGIVEPFKDSRPVTRGKWPVQHYRLRTSMETEERERLIGRIVDCLHDGAASPDELRQVVRAPVGEIRSALDTLLALGEIEPVRICVDRMRVSEVIKYQLKRTKKGTVPPLQRAA